MYLDIISNDTNMNLQKHKKQLLKANPGEMISVGHTELEATEYSIIFLVNSIISTLFVYIVASL